MRAYSRKYREGPGGLATHDLRTATGMKQVWLLLDTPRDEIKTDYWAPSHSITMERDLAFPSSGRQELRSHKAKRNKQTKRTTK